MPVDIGSIKRNDQIAGAATVLAFILSLIPGAVSFSLKDEFKGQAGPGADTSESVNLWHGIGVLAAILLLIAVAGVVASILSPAELQAIPVRWITAAALALTSVLVLIYILTYDADAPAGADEVFDIGPGIVGWILLVVCVVATVFAAMGAQESGEQLPGRGQSAGPAQPTPPPAA
jgi:hypothetical protein